MRAAWTVASDMHSTASPASSYETEDTVRQTSLPEKKNPTKLYRPSSNRSLPQEVLVCVCVCVFYTLVTLSPPVAICRPTIKMISIKPGSEAPGSATGTTSLRVPLCPNKKKKKNTVCAEVNHPVTPVTQNVGLGVLGIN